MCGSSTCTIAVDYESSNPYIAAINENKGTVTPKDTGNVVLSATTYAYGKEYHDSVSFRIGFALSGTITGGTNDSWGYWGGDGLPNVSYNEKPRIIVGVGAVIDWYLFNFIPNKPITITFSNPEALDTATSYVEQLPPSGRGNITSVYCDTLTNYTCEAPNALVQARRFIKTGLLEVHCSLFPDQVYYIDVRED
jgi:hypothetical protein